MIVLIAGIFVLVFIAYGVRVAWYVLSGEYAIDERIRGVK